MSTDFALVGCERISRKHCEALKKVEGAKLVAVCDLIRDKAESTGRQWGVPWYTSHETMLGEIHPAVVNVCTESGHHASVAIDVMKRFGCNVIVEKPMALQLSDADAMIHMAREAHVRLFTVKQNRFNGPIQLLKRALDEGRFGRVLMITSRARWHRTQEYYDLTSWRGTPYCLLHALWKKLGTARVTSATLVRPGKWASGAELFKCGCARLVGRGYRREFAPTALASFLAQLEQLVPLHGPDIVPSIGSQSMAAAHLSVPVVMWRDATFSAMVHSNPKYGWLACQSKLQGERAEYLAVGKAAIAVFSSTWVARSAIEGYHKDSWFVRVVPFGANPVVVPSAERVAANITDRNRESCSLLFVGTDWQRRRGNSAVAVTHELNAMGVHARLQVAGCSLTLHDVIDSQVDVLVGFAGTWRTNYRGFKNSIIRATS